MIQIYNILTYLVLILCLPFLPVIWLCSAKRRANMLQRFGFQSIPEKKPPQKRIWVHALSVGEVKSALPFVHAFQKRHPQWEILFSASTKTGYETACELYLNGGNPVEHVFYFPFDVRFSVRRIADKVNPDLVVLTETDLWPSFLHEMHQRKVQVILINARLSIRSLKGFLIYWKINFAFYRYLTYIMVQSRIDAARFEELGIPEDRLYVSGNIKFDQSMEEADNSFVKKYRGLLGINEETKVLIAGSTHKGEEEILLAAYRELKIKCPELKMIIAPRNPDRSNGLAATYEKAGLKVDLLSRISGSAANDSVILVDSMGLLSGLYALCDIAFVGGSMVEQGGHNPLEPAAFGKPVLFGGDMSDFLEISLALIDAKAAMQVESADELAQKAELLLTRAGLRRETGENGRKLFLTHKGAVDRILDMLQQKNFV